MVGDACLRFDIRRADANIKAVCFPARCRSWSKICSRCVSLFQWRACGVPAGGHMGPPLRRHTGSFFVIARRAAGPTRQSVSPSKEKRIPTAPPGPRNDGAGAQCAPLQGGGQVAPSSGPAGHPPPRGKVRRVKDAAPYKGCASKSLPLTREVAGRRPDGGRDRAATWGRPYENFGPL